MVAGVCTLGMLLVYESLAINYGVTYVDKSYERTFDANKDLIEVAGNLSDETKRLISKEPGFTDIIGTIYRGGGLVIKVIFGTAIVLHAMVVDGGEALSIPAYFTNIILGIAIITLTLLILSVILRFKLGGE